MLVLSRRYGESLEIGEQVKVTVVKISGNQVRLGIDAPRQIVVRREEVARAARQAPGDENHPLRILLVDDCPEDREAYRRLIQVRADRKYELSETDSGEDALALCRSAAPPDCVLLDYLLPDLNGLEFLEELSGLSPELPVHVVMLTGHGDESVAVQAMKRGAQDYLVKNRLTGDVLWGALNAATPPLQSRRPGAPGITTSRHSDWNRKPGSSRIR